MRNLTSLLIVFTLWLGLVLGCTAPQKQDSTPKSLTAEHRSAIQASLRKIGYPQPNELEINDTGFLVATFELRGPVDRLSLKSFAEDSIMAIREAMLPFKAIERYRVTLNGPSPGTGMIRRYGNARLIEGGAVEWEPAD